MSRTEYTIFKKIEIRPYKFKELKALYDVDDKTLKFWFHKFDIKLKLKGAYFTADTVVEIFAKLGHPYEMRAVDANYVLLVKPYKLNELAKIYQVHSKTFKRNYIDPSNDIIGEMTGLYYLIPQVETIIRINEFPHTIYKTIA